MLLEKELRERESEDLCEKKKNVKRVMNDRACFWVFLTFYFLDIFCFLIIKNLNKINYYRHVMSACYEYVDSKICNLNVILILVIFY
jgi:hypothetical protein